MRILSGDKRGTKEGQKRDNQAVIAFIFHSSTVFFFMVGCPAGSLDTGRPLFLR